MRAIARSSTGTRASAAAAMADPHSAMAKTGPVPFRSVVAEDRSVDPAWLSENGPSLAIGVGLAVRKLGE